MKKIKSRTTLEKELNTVREALRTLEQSDRDTRELFTDMLQVGQLSYGIRKVATWHEIEKAVGYFCWAKGTALKGKRAKCCHGYTKNRTR